MQSDAALTQRHGKFKRFRYLLIVPFLALLLVLQFFADRNGLNRVFWIAIFFLVVVATVYLVFQKKGAIRAAEKGTRKLEIARIKFEGELAAGCALLAVVGLFYQLGLDMDRMSTQGQAIRWRSAYDQFQANMSETFCLVVPSRKAKCQTVKDDLNLLFSSIYLPKEEPTATVANRIIHTVRHELDVPLHSDQAKGFDAAIATLQSMDLSEGILDKVAKYLSIFSIMFGSIAVSSKIAVAWADLEERQTNVSR